MRAVARRRAKLAAVLGVVALAVLGYASFEFAGHVTGATAATSRTAAPAAPADPAARRPSPAGTAPGKTTPTAIAATPHSSRPATAAREQVLAPVSAVAFGPDGTADGDHPEDADRVLTDPADGWLTDWYTTPAFGDLKTGTGLLLDMGRTVTITSVLITFGGLPGARLELRLGAGPSFASLEIAKTATATSDVLTVPLAVPARARYVLLWFISLPPDGTGTYQVSVHQVTIHGQP